MDPKEYYYNRFRSQFNEFVKKSRIHEHQGEGFYLSIRELNKENLSHIPHEDYTLFHCALACTILIDQVMYTHFKIDYPNFQKMTLYPKMEYGISSMNINPWSITHNGIGNTTFGKFIEYFVNDLKEFFAQNHFVDANWENVRTAMLNDKDVTFGRRGQVLKESLMKDKN